jgi:hypothetical protein
MIRVCFLAPDGTVASEDATTGKLDPRTNAKLIRALAERRAMKVQEPDGSTSYIVRQTASTSR